MCTLLVASLSSSFYDLSLVLLASCLVDLGDDSLVGDLDDDFDDEVVDLVDEADDLEVEERGIKNCFKF